MTYDGRHIRGGDTLMEYVVPVYVLEEGLSFDLFGIALSRPETAGGVAC